MHLPSALTKCGNCSQGDLFKEIARNYKACMRDMVNRAPGMTLTWGKKWSQGCF